MVDWIKKEHNAEVSLDINNFLPEPMIEEDPDPLRIIAKRVLGFPGLRVCWPYNTWREEFLDQCREYKIEAMVLGGHFGCSNIGGFYGLMRDDLRKELGIPTLMLDTDPIDPRIVSIEEQKRKIEDLLVTIKR